MKCVLLAIFACAAVAGASVLSRPQRQVWGFPEDPVTSVNIPARPGTSTAATTTRGTTTPSNGMRASTPSAGMRTSTPPAGVIFQVKDCNCQAPPQFNPVCGTDGNTYVNRQKLDCTRRCGYDVQVARLGSC